jgi:hypothetical protein
MADQFTLPINELPNPAPLNNILSNSATLTASVSMALEQSPRGLAENRPPPLSGEPGPQIDYKLLQVVLNKTKELLAPETMGAILKLANIRKKYWMALSGYAQLHRHIQDIWVQRQKLVDRADAIKLAAVRYLSTLNAQLHSPRFVGLRQEDLRCAYKVKVETLLRHNAYSQILNAKEARDAVGKYILFAKGLAKLSETFVQVKLEAMPSIYQAQNVMLAFWGDWLAAAAETSSEAVSGDATTSGLPPYGQENGVGNYMNYMKRGYDMIDNADDGNETIPEPKKHHGIEAEANEGWWAELEPLDGAIEGYY